MNSLPFFNLSTQIRSIKSSQNSYIAVQTGENNKISIINSEYIAFKLIDTFICKGFNKET